MENKLSKNKWMKTEWQSGEKADKKTENIGEIMNEWMNELEQLERLRSEDTPRRLMITHTIDQFILLTSSYRIPSQNKVKAEKVEKLVKNWNFRILS